MDGRGGRADTRAVSAAASAAAAADASKLVFESVVAGDQKRKLLSPSPRFDRMTQKRRKSRRKLE